MTLVLAFDVNETLLDLSALDDRFEQLFGSAALRPLWFAQMLQLAFVGGLTGDYVDFTQAQQAALRMLGARTGAKLSDAEVTDTVDMMRTLPPHPEVDSALRRLAATPLKLCALTNSTATVAEDQLANAGLRTHFEAALSADTVRALKPAAAPYRLVADTFGVPLGEVRLIAAHAWDVTGALTAGARAAFVARPGMVLSPLGPVPDIVAADLTGIADKVLARDLAGGRA